MHVKESHAGRSWPHLIEPAGGRGKNRRWEDARSAIAPTCYRALEPRSPKVHFKVRKMHLGIRGSGAL